MRSRVDLSRLADSLGGLPVLGCLDGSPAAEAGVRYGDILLAVDGVPTRTWDDFLRARAATRGRFVARIFRDGVELEVTVELRANPPGAAEVLADMISQRVLPNAIGLDGDDDDLN